MYLYFCIISTYLHPSYFCQIVNICKVGVSIYTFGNDMIFMYNASYDKYKEKSHCCTVWKFQIFSDTQILREINFGKSEGSKTSILAILGIPIFHFWKAKMTEENWFHGKSEWQKISSISTLCVVKIYDVGPP